MENLFLHHHSGSQMLYLVSGFLLYILINRLSVSDYVFPLCLCWKPGSQGHSNWKAPESTLLWRPVCILHCLLVSSNIWYFNQYPTEPECLSCWKCSKHLHQGLTHGLTDHLLTCSSESPSCVFYFNRLFYVWLGTEHLLKLLPCFPSLRHMQAEKRVKDCRLTSMKNSWASHFFSLAPSIPLTRYAVRHTLTLWKTGYSELADFKAGRELNPTQIHLSNNP